MEIAVSAPGDPDTLRAAGSVAATIGQWQAGRHADALVGLASAGDPADIVVASGAATPLAFAATVPGDHGLLALSQDGPPQLLVGGATPAEVAEAAGALATASGGPTATLTGAPPAPVPDATRPWTGGAATLAQLGLGPQRVTGAGLHEITVPVDRPGGWRIKGHPRLDLVLDSSTNLDAGRSSVQLEVAGIDLGTRALRGGGGPQTYSYDIPPGLIDRRVDGRPVRSLDTTVRLLLQPSQDRCQPYDPEAAWASVLPTTTFRLPHDDADSPELARFPYPILGGGGGGGGGTDGAAVVLPSAPTSDVLTAGLQVAAALGRWSDPGTTPPLLVTADGLDRKATAHRGLVLLGDADVQVFGHPLDVGRPTIELGPGQVIAVLGVAPSPSDKTRSVLAIHADGPGLLLAARTLATETGLEQLRGSRVALVGARSAVTLSGSQGGSPPPELAPVLPASRPVTRQSWAVPAVVLLAGFVTALFLLARYRWAPRRRAA